tara:strand:- start:196 stop:471 length:276 start_codon:yes stop_codon:yes gene_type:complete
MDKQYDWEVPQFLCWWEDTIGVYTEEELYEEYKDTNLFDEDEQIGWGGYSTYSSSINLDTFQEVLKYLKENEDLILNTKFISHNMNIVRVI